MNIKPLCVGVTKYHPVYHNPIIMFMKLLNKLLVNIMMYIDIFFHAVYIVLIPNHTSTQFMSTRKSPTNIISNHDDSLHTMPAWRIMMGVYNRWS